MSYVFDIDGETVWSPALLAGQVYVMFVSSLEQVLQVRAGFSAVADDMVEIDRDQFSAFVDRLMQFDTGGRHPILAETVAPIVAVSLVMLRRSPLGLQEPKSMSEALRRATERLDSQMPR